MGFTVTKSNRPLLDRLFEPIRSNRAFRLIYSLAALNGYAFSGYFFVRSWYTENLVNILYGILCFGAGFVLCYIYGHWYTTSKSKCFARNLTREELECREPIFEPDPFGGITFRLLNPKNLDGERFTEIYGAKEKLDR